MITLKDVLINHYKNKKTQDCSCVLVLYNTLIYLSKHSSKKSLKLYNVSPNGSISSLKE